MKTIEKAIIEPLKWWGLPVEVSDYPLVKDHRPGEVVLLRVPGMTSAQLGGAILTMIPEFDQLIWYDEPTTHVRISYVNRVEKTPRYLKEWTNRREVLHWTEQHQADTEHPPELFAILENPVQKLPKR